MSYSRPFLRLIAIGRIWGVEDFTFGMSLINTGAPPGPAPTEVPPAIVAAFETFWQGAAIGSQARLYTLKLNLIGTDGRYVNDDTVLHDYVASGIPGLGPNNPPPQIAYAVTLQTARARGRAARGRFYLPLPSAAAQDAGRISEGAAEQYRTYTDALLQVINSAVPNYHLGVVSSIGSGTQNLVQNARYGRALDTIRSRRENVDEGYIDGEDLGNPDEE